ncbi:MAG: sensor histidine kinase [Bacteroidales bacterium]|jgi:signal transduction histidine kinase|nr:sensor histidine kinase [Bacteroidales bacterium]
MIRILSYICLGALLFQGNIANAQSEEISALFGCISEKDSPAKVDCYVKLASIYRQLNKDSSLLFCDEAYRISKDIGYIEGVWDALYKKCQTLDKMGNIMDALEYGERCLFIADSIGDDVRIGKSYFKAAGLYTDIGDTRAALLYYHHSLQIFKERNDSNALVAIYNGLGNYFGDLYIMDSAAYYYHMAVDLGELIGFEHAIGIMLGNLGIIYSDLGDYDNAKKYYLLSLESNVETENLNEIPKNYSRLANVEKHFGNYEAALRYFDKADSALIRVKDSLQMMEVAINRASMYVDMEKSELALPILKRVAKYYRQQNFVEGMQSLWQIYATIYLNAGNTDMAMLYHDSIIKLAKLHSNLYQIRGSYEDIYLIELERGNHKEALEAYIQVGIYSDSIFDLEKAELMNDLRLKYEKEKDQLEILELKHKNLQKTKERNLLFFTVLGIVFLGIFLIAFLVFNHRKNKIISAQKIRQLEEEKKHLAARFLVEGEERERKRVAMELHDNLGVLLSATKMSFSEIRDKSPENAELITKASRLLEQASSDVRKISHNLMPGLLTKLGLYEALEELFENLNDQHGMDAFMEVVGPKNRLDENTEIMIYRMMQEIINNTLKHAEAKSVDMVMIVDENEINITYSDDGKGFDPDQTLKKKTLGLQSIRSRVKFLSGLFSIKSEPGVGTVYRICIPITEGYCSELSE